MKKLFILACLAASVTLSSCGGSSSNGSASSADASAEKGSTSSKGSASGLILPLSADASAVKELDKTVDKDGFSFSYPSSLPDAGDFGGDKGARLNDGKADFSFMITDDIIDIKAQDEADNMYGMLDRGGQKPEPATVKPNGYTIKASKGDETIWKFAVIKGRNQVFGTYSYPTADAAKYEKYLAAIMQSVTFKE